LGARILTADAQIASLKLLAADDDVKEDSPGTLDAAYNVRLEAFTAYNESGEGKLAQDALDEANAAIEVREAIPEGEEANALEAVNQALADWNQAKDDTQGALDVLEGALDGADLAALRSAVEGYSNPDPDTDGTWDVANNTLLGYVQAVADAEVALKNAKDARDAAVHACQIAKYDEYRESLEVAMIARNNDLATIKALMTQELEKPEPGTAGARCEKALSNGTYRPARGEETCAEGLCCGAARVWMAVGDGVEDAAWRTIETCQAEDTETYMYQPPRQPMQTEMPDQISATFTCIEGAKKLAAAASAVAAAVYMLA